MSESPKSRVVILPAARGPLTLDARDMIAGGVDNWGKENWTCKGY
jgi:hypothetical protein